MNDLPPTPRRSETGLVLCTGFLALIGTAWTLLIGWPLLALPCLIIAVVTLRAGLVRLGRTSHPGRLVAITVLPTIALAPLVLAAPFLVLLIPQYARAIVHGPNIVLCERSPDGEFEAYVVDVPCVDGPDHNLYVEYKDGIRYIQIAALPEDVDAVQQITWSPHGDIVVFQTRFALIAARVPGWQTVKIPLGGEWTRIIAGKGGTFTAGGLQRRISGIEFPGPGIVSYTIDGESDSHVIRMDEL